MAEQLSKKDVQTLFDSGFFVNETEGHEGPGATIALTGPVLPGRPEVHVSLVVSRETARLLAHRLLAVVEPAADTHSP
ncbi:MAG: hypothetical protein JSV79_08790 [Armatimonadota bacterium]|nr:MAG: hypothetical protein JSV79_08790 [Armatimonadota bacterium]